MTLRCFLNGSLWIQHQATFNIMAFMAEPHWPQFSVAMSISYLHASVAGSEKGVCEHIQYIHYTIYYFSFLHICVDLSVFAYSICSGSCVVWVSSSKVECVINVLFGADWAGPGKLYGPRGGGVGGLIMAVSLEPVCQWMTNNCKRHSTEKHTQACTLPTLI